MSGDIQPGDVVQIVSSEFCTGPWPNHHTEPSYIGKVGRVIDVWLDKDFGLPRAVLTIAADRGGCCTGCLRKIDAPNTEISTQIRAYKPVRECV